MKKYTDSWPRLGCLCLCQKLLYPFFAAIKPFAARGSEHLSRVSGPKAKFSASEITSPTRFTVSYQCSHVSSEDETAATKTHYLVSATPAGWPRFSPPAEPRTCPPAPHQAETSPLFSRAKAEAEQLSVIYTSSHSIHPPYSCLHCASSFAKATPLKRSPPLESSLPPHRWSPLTSHCQSQQPLSLPV